jgi:hypothetical protein
VEGEDLREPVLFDLVIFAMPHGRSQPLIETGREMRAMYVLNDKAGGTPQV